MNDFPIASFTFRTTYPFRCHQIEEVKQLTLMMFSQINRHGWNFFGTDSSRESQLHNLFGAMKMTDILHRPSRHMSGGRTWQIPSDSNGSQDSFVAEKYERMHNDNYSIQMSDKSTVTLRNW
jgi:hypothetical protein